MTREEAIEVLKKTVPYTSEFADARTIAIRSLEADVRENKHGHWTLECECSVCGYGVAPWSVGTNFCPNCGARMEES